MDIWHRLEIKLFPIVKRTVGTAAPIRIIPYLSWKLGLRGKVYWPIHRSSRVSFPQNIKIGKGTAPGLSINCYIQGLNGIDIGDYTIIGPGVNIISADHDLTDFSSHNKGDGRIIIGKNCWLGANSIILPGCIIGDNTVVAAGSVVTKSFPKGNVLIAGIPGRIIKSLPDLNQYAPIRNIEYKGFKRVNS